MNIENYLEMTPEQLDELNLSNEVLIQIHLEHGIFHSRAVLRMNETCFQKFGIKPVSDTAAAVHRRIINERACPTDTEMLILENEEINNRMKEVLRTRKENILNAEKLGEAYSPELVFQDKTDFGVN